MPTSTLSTSPDSCAIAAEETPTNINNDNPTANNAFAAGAIRFANFLIITGRVKQSPQSIVKIRISHHLRPRRHQSRTITERNHANTLSHYGQMHPKRPKPPTLPQSVNLDLYLEAYSGPVK